MVLINNQTTNKINLILTIILGLSLVLPSAYPETIILKNGKTIKGKITEQTDDYIKIDYYGIPLTYYLEDIDKIKQKNSEIKLSEKEHERFGYHFIQGTECYKTGLLDEALFHLEKAAMLNPNHFASNFAAGVVSRLLKKYKKALSYLEKAKQINPNNSGVNLELGFLHYFGFKNFKKAEYYFKKTIELDPRMKPAYAALEKIYKELGEHKKVREIYNKYEEINF